jgi:hypothetical protein
MYSICDFTALISEEQNLEKTNYEKPNAYVGGHLDIGGKHFGERSGKEPYWPWY